jgi:hypothetical protein
MESFTKFFTSLGGVLTSLAAVVGGVVALYVAFGSGGDTASQGSNPPAVVDTTSDATTSDAAIEEWRTEAEKVCRDLKRRATRLGPPPGDLAGLVSWMQQQMPIASSAASEMRALEEPDAIADDVGRFLDSLDNQVELNMTMFNALQAGDAVTFENARLEGQAAANDTDRFAADLGLQECVAYT